MSPHVETELIAYLDGELSAQERARVEAHLTECPRCARAVERLRALRQDLGATFNTALSPVRLPAEADARIRDRLRARIEPRPWLALWRRRGLIAQAVLGALTLLFALNTAQVLRLPPPAAPHETLVLGQNRLAPGVQAALRVLVRSTDGAAEPIEGSEVVVKIGRPPGLAQVVYTGQTNASGTANVAFTVPEDLEGGAQLVIETSSVKGEDRIVHPITIARDYRLLLGSDKPAYRPGQTIHLRALALDATNLKPTAGAKITFVVIDATGQRLVHHGVETSEFGIAARDYALLPNAAPGQYTLRATLGDTVSERTVTVGDYELPAFRVTLGTDRAYYTPGERVTGSVQAEYFFGKPVAGGHVILRGYTRDPRGTPAIVVQAQTDEEGTARFAFYLPPGFGQSATVEPFFFDLEADVLDAAGQRAGIRQFVPVAAQTILIRAVPESGKLKPGIENTVYVLTAYPDGRPAPTSLTIEAAGETHSLDTDPHGLAEFRYVPGDAAQITIHAQDAQGAQSSTTFGFQTDRLPQTLLLRAERAAYEVGDTLRAEALVAGPQLPQAVYLDVVRARQTIATFSAPVEDGRALFAFDLDQAMVGTLELHAYYVDPGDNFVRDTRLVIVDAPRQVAVAMSADQDTYRPSETAHLQIQTALTSTNQRISQPVQSALGIGVVDSSVEALETLPSGFVRAYFLMEQELRERPGQGLDVPTLLEAEEELRASQDVAARAAWAGASGADFTLVEESTAAPMEDTAAAARVALSNRIGLALALLPLLLSGVVAWGLRITGALGRALRRVGIGALVLFLASPVLFLVVGGAMWLLWAALGAIAPAMVLVAIVALLTWLAAHGWLRRDTRLQLATGFAAAYLVLGGLLVVLAARGDDSSGLLLAAIVIAFLLAVAALTALGQGLVVEGWRATGWATTALALLLIPLAIYLPFVPGAASGLTKTLGNPALYAGPAGWLTGCCPAPAATAEPAAATKAPTAKPTAELEKEITAEPVAPTKAAAATGEPTPLPSPTPALPSSTPAPTVVSLPTEPYPLRQVFPETLYWNAEAVTDEDGSFGLDLELADSVTTWRLTALASTREGDLGVATYDIVVFQDFFVELDLPTTITQGETITVTVTLYNYLPQPQTIRLEPEPAGWYTFESLPQDVTLPAEGVATATLTIRAERAGDFTLQVNAVGEGMSDAVARDVTVKAP